MPSLFKFAGASSRSTPALGKVVVVSVVAAGTPPVEEEVLGVVAFLVVGAVAVVRVPLLITGALLRVESVVAEGTLVVVVGSTLVVPLATGTLVAAGVSRWASMFAPWAAEGGVATVDVLGPGK